MVEDIGRDRLPWLVGLGALIPCALALLLLQMGIVSDCQSEPSCETLCQSDCMDRHLKAWVVTQAILTAATAVGVITLRSTRRLVIAVLGGHVVAAVIMVMLR